MIDRYLAIESIVKHVGSTDLILSTTGMISRELFSIHDRPENFYMLGSMGLLSSFGLGLALMVPSQKIIIIEGDGSAMMGLGTLPLIASEEPSNLIHIILDNEAYESTGGQSSISSRFDLAEVARSSGYPKPHHVRNLEELELALTESYSSGALSFILVKVGISPVAGIPRVTHTPYEIRDRFKSTIQPTK